MSYNAIKNTVFKRGVLSTQSYDVVKMYMFDLDQTGDTLVHSAAQSKVIWSLRGSHTNPPVIIIPTYVCYKYTYGSGQLQTIKYITTDNDPPNAPTIPDGWYVEDYDITDTFVAGTPSYYYFKCIRIVNGEKVSEDYETINA